MFIDNKVTRKLIKEDDSKDASFIDKDDESEEINILFNKEDDIFNRWNFIKETINIPAIKSKILL